MPMRGPEKARGALAAGLERLVRSGERSGLFEAHLAIGHGLSQAGLQPRQAGSLDLRQHVAASWVCGRRTASASSSSYIRRSRLVGHHAGQPAPDVVFGNGVDTLRRVGLRFHSIRRRRGRDDSPQAAQARGAGTSVRRIHLRHRLGMPGQGRIRNLRPTKGLAKCRSPDFWGRGAAERARRVTSSIRPSRRRPGSASARCAPPSDA